jgi:sec-independent protein translocase protein TatC
MAEKESMEPGKAPGGATDPYAGATLPASPADAATLAEVSPAATAPLAQTTTDAAPDRSDERRMSFLDHLAELRTRLRNAALAFLATTIASFIFVQKYFDWLTRPVRAGLRDAGHEMNFYARSLTEPFWVYMKLALVGGVLLAAPFIIYELWRFVAPGLYRKERRIGMLIGASTAVCFVGGAIFAYTLLSQPAAYYLSQLFTTFAGDLPFKLDTMLMMDEVASFQMLTLAGTGLAFELPVVLTILGWLGIVSSRGLLKFDKYAIVLSFLVGAIVTPSTDPFTQTLLALPIFVLYNLSILVVWLLERAQRKREAATEAAT